jgi:hypothetical protein
LWRLLALFWLFRLLLPPFIGGQLFSPLFGRLLPSLLDELS